MLFEIQPQTADGKMMEPIPVICAALNGKLAVHRSIDEKGYTVTHVPSGFAARTRIRSKKNAVDLMLELETLGDWDFRNPFGAKWKGQMQALAPIVAKVPRY